MTPVLLFISKALTSGVLTKTMEIRKLATKQEYCHFLSARVKLGFLKENLMLSPSLID
jgi:hypothetical protein